MKNIKISNIFDHLDEWQKVTKVKTKELPENMLEFLKNYILESNSIKRLTNQKFYNYKAIELKPILNGLKNPEIYNKILDSLFTENNIDKYYDFIKSDLTGSDKIKAIIDTNIIPLFQKNNIPVFDLAIEKSLDEYEVHVDEPEYYLDEVEITGQNLADNSVTGEVTDEEKIEYQSLFINYLLDMIITGNFNNNLIDNYMLPEFDIDNTDEIDNTQIKNVLLDIVNLSVVLSQYVIDNQEISDIFNSDNVVDSYPFSDSFDELSMSINDWSINEFNFDCFKNLNKSQFNHTLIEIQNNQEYLDYFAHYIIKFDELSKLIKNVPNYDNVETYPFNNTVEQITKELKKFQAKFLDEYQKVYKDEYIISLIHSIFYNWTRVSNNWNDSLNTDKYPFSDSFDEYLFGLRNWLEIYLTDEIIDSPTNTIRTKNPKEQLKYLIGLIENLDKELKEYNGETNFIKHNPFIPDEFLSFKELIQRMTKWYKSIK